ncbi:hypothetical protein [Sphingomonas sp. S6]|jgi:hypothetical protein|uniref:hypothetical protein n=1 Tax=Sphingomonas sp. S6 TaxID=3368600 RepID=UPI0028EBD99F|nr:hypothetical protein [uncultured Sphingomonas sp.]
MTHMVGRGWALTLLVAAASVPAPLLARPLANGASAPSTFIVSCDCATPAKRARVQRRIERAGGRILYPYASIGGFAVTARRPQDGAALRRRLTHIPGIQSVHPDTAIRLAPPGAPQ